MRCCPRSKLSAANQVLLMLFSPFVSISPSPLSASGVSPALHVHAVLRRCVSRVKAIVETSLANPNSGVSLYRRLQPLPGGKLLPFQHEEAEVRPCPGEVWPAR